MPDNVRHLSGAVTVDSDTVPGTLVMLRERLDLSRKALADLIGRTSVYLRTLESKPRVLSARDAAALCQALRVPPEALTRAHPGTIELGGTFRTHGVGIRRTRQCLARANLAADAAAELLTMPEVTASPPPRTPLTPGSADAVGEARSLRYQLSLDTRPIGDMGGLMERIGHILLPSPHSEPGDPHAFTLIDSARLDGVPVVFIDEALTHNEQRFALARELGRIFRPDLTDARRAPAPDQPDMRLDSFALEFLAPADGLDGVLDGAQPSTDMPLVRATQQLWGVDSHKLLARARDLGAITERSRVTWAQAWRDAERLSPAPDGAPATFTTVADTLTALHDAGWTRFMLAARLGLHDTELSLLLPGWGGTNDVTNETSDSRLLSAVR